MSKFPVFPAPHCGIAEVCDATRTSNRAAAGYQTFVLIQSQQICNLYGNQVYNKYHQ